MRVDRKTTLTEVVSPPDEDQVLDAVEMFRMLADATRVRILRALSVAPNELGRAPGEMGRAPGEMGGAAGEMSVNELATAVSKRPGSVSQHLAKLRMARLVTTRRDGNQILYRVANEHVSQLVADALRHSEHLGPGTPAHHQAHS